jgi:hypothetical protein
MNNNIAYIDFKIDNVSLRLLSTNEVKIKYKDEEWQNFNWQNKNILTEIKSY